MLLPADGGRQAEQISLINQSFRTLRAEVLEVRPIIRICNTRTPSGPAEATNRQPWRDNRTSHLVPKRLRNVWRRRNSLRTMYCTARCLRGLCDRSTREGAGRRQAPKANAVPDWQHTVPTCQPGTTRNGDNTTFHMESL